MVKPYPFGSRIALGVDLGQASDYSALAIVERVDAPKVKPVFNIRRVERLPLGTSYPAVIEHVQGVLRLANMRGAKLLVDAQGVGMPVVDSFKAVGLAPVAVKVHGGSDETHEGHVYRIPKRNLVAATRILYEAESIRAAEDTPHLALLERELLTFKVKTTDHAHDSYEAWRETDHDDLVFALGLCCWYLTRPLKGVWGF